MILTALVGPSDIEALEHGRFRLKSGQVTYRMYDRFSLRQLLLTSGFSDVVLRGADESGAACWHSVTRDLSEDGGIARPHTLIMEGSRPA